ncbi:MAG: hypothetical protein H5U13_09645 [Parvibaculum sp.]|nr:hypothetical protein [Parvibaculum sp.]
MSMNNPDSAAEKARSNMMRLGLVAVAMAGVIAFYVLTGRVDLNEPVELTACVTQPATWTESGPLTLGVAVTLANNTDEPLPLSLASQCDIFRWFLTDEDQNLVQSQRSDEPCVDLPMQGNLEAKHNISGEFTLTLDPARVKPGRYILFMRYWGHEHREPVTVG